MRIAFYCAKHLYVPYSQYGTQRIFPSLAVIAQMVDIQCLLEMEVISAAVALKEFTLPLEFCAFSHFHFSVLVVSLLVFFLKFNLEFLFQQFYLYQIILIVLCNVNNMYSLRI